MKKHPIDEVFRSKLSKVEIEPSENAWEKLNSNKIDNKRRIFLWQWFAAAGVAFACLLSYEIWQKQVVSLADDNQMVVIEQPVLEDSVKSHDNYIDKQFKEKRKVVAIGTPTDSNKSRNHIKESKSIAPHNLISENEVTKNETDTPPLSELEISRIRTAEVAVNHRLENTNIPEIAMINDLKPKDRHIIVQVETSVETEDKSGRIVKFFKQLKNVKEGEPVDWHEVGINPKYIFARVDDN